MAHSNTTQKIEPIAEPLPPEPVSPAAPAQPAIQLAEFPKPKRPRRREPTRQIAGTSEPVEYREPVLPEAPKQERVLEEKSAPRKAVWLWLSTAATQHNLQHSLSNGTNSRFRSHGAPALGLRAGFEVEDFGIDASYESSPGKVSSAPNATVEGGSYHWNALRADATWRGLGHDWKLRAGAQQHTSPLLYPDNTAARIYIRRARLNFAALGLEWSPRISESSRLEAKATYLHALSADTLDRAEIEISRRLSGTLSLGWIHSAGDHLRLGTYWQSEIQSYGFTYRSAPGAAASPGNQKITSHSLGLSIGWEY
jgi:hypothetical protein